MTEADQNQAAPAADAGATNVDAVQAAQEAPTAVEAEQAAAAPPADEPPADGAENGAADAVKDVAPLSADQLAQIAALLSDEIKAGMEGLKGHLDDVSHHLDSLDERLAKAESALASLDVEKLAPMIDDAKAISSDLQKHNFGDLATRLLSLEQRLKHFL